MLPKAENHWTLNEAAHLLNRAGFGGSPDEIRDLHAMGRHKAVEHLLNAKDDADFLPLPGWAEPEQAMEDAREFASMRGKFRKEMRNASSEELEKKRREAFKEIQRMSRERGIEAQGWWFRRILRTKAPLCEKMTLFWHDHFATSIQKVKQPVLMIRQNEMFRKHALGSFQELTAEVVEDPAMMLYLDTQSSKKGKPNENFAREVMELFTLGEGNYTEEDIRQAARAFTGYQLNRFNGEVSLNRRKWDDGEKTVFGKTGEFDGKDIVALIFEKPEAARFMTRKLWEFFVYENPADGPIHALAGAFQKSGFRVKPLLREIFLSQEFYSEVSIRSQIKSPVQFTISLLKQLEIESPPPGFPITAQQQLGQTLFLPPNVAGWDWGQAWINTNTLLTRYNLAGFLTKGTDNPMIAKGAGSKVAKKFSGKGMKERAARGWDGPDYEQIAPRSLRDNPEELVDALVFRFFQGPVPEKARTSFIEYAISKKGAIFTNKETAELCHLMLSTPYYQLC